MVKLAKIKNIALNKGDGRLLLSDVFLAHRWED